MTATSRLGEPLRAELSLDEASSEQIEAACFKIAPRPADADDLPRLSSASFVIDRHRQPARLRLTTALPVYDPIFMVDLSVGCGVELTRAYTLLLEPPESSTVVTPKSGASEARERASSSHARSARTAGAGTSEWQVNEGETLESISQTLYPGKPRAQRRWINATARANPDLFREEEQPASAVLPAGTILTVPQQRRMPDARPRHKPKEATKADRLSIREPSSDEYDRHRAPAPDLSRASKVTDRQQDLQGEEQRLLAALDEQAVRQYELSERIKKMQQSVTRLKSSLKQIDQAMANVAGTTQPAPTTAPAAPVALPPGRATEPVSKAKPTSGLLTDWLLFLLLSAAVLALLLFLRRRSLRPQLASKRPPARTEENARATEGASAPAINASLPPRLPHAPRASEASIQRSSSADEQNINVSEHDSALEMAEIMLSFGRVQGAAQTLADYIEANPKQTLRPWLKLLEVYRDAGMQTEFDTLAERLNQTFNIERLTWHQAPPQRFADALEGYPHLSAKLVETWGSQAGLDFLRDLVQDNRSGTRAGFPLAVLREIMLLGAILEEHLSGHD